MNTRLARAAAAIALAASISLGAHAETTWIGSDCVPQMTPLQERLYQKRNEGDEALRRFILVRRGVVDANFDVTVEWASAVDEARSRCVRRVAEGRAERQEVAARDKMN